MSDRITDEGENATPTQLPKNSVQKLALDGLPLVFSDVEMEIKQNPDKFKEFEGKEEEFKKINKNNISKSEVGRIWMFKRWVTWKYLESLPKKTIIITLEESEMGQRGKVRGNASVNGVVYYIIKGQYVEVPSDIAQIIADSQGQTIEALNENLVANLGQKIDPVTGAPKDPTRLDR